MLRDSGLHAALPMGALAVLGAILEHVAVGMALGLLAAALVTWRWPVPDDAVPAHDTWDDGVDDGHGPAHRSRDGRNGGD